MRRPEQPAPAYVREVSSWSPRQFADEYADMAKERCRSSGGTPLTTLVRRAAAIICGDDRYSQERFIRFIRRETRGLWPLSRPYLGRGPRCFDCGGPVPCTRQD